MVDHQVAGIKTYLTNMSLHASPEWLEGCVEFFVSEHNDQEYTVAALKDFVLQQWKLADLREMGQGCLPLNLNSIMKTVLPGKYALQVERIQNIGQSAYMQLQDIRKQVNENVEVGATLPQTWEPRPTRMLHLSLTDGFQNIKGIEYRPIMSLNEQLLPGCKVLIVGPVECRRGTLLLEQHNLEILGGEIDSLLIPNANENILAEVLNLPQNLDPYRTQTDVSIKSQMTLPQEPVAQRNDLVQQKATGPSQIQMVAAPVLNTVHKPVSSKNNTTQIPKGNSVRRIEEELFNEDDFMLEAEMDAHLSVLESKYQEEMENSLNNLDIDEIEQKSLGDLQAECSEKTEFESSHYQQVPMQLEKAPYSSEKKLTQNCNPSYLLNDDDDILLQLSLKELERPKVQSTLQRNQMTGSSLITRQNHQTEHHMKSLPGGQYRIGPANTPKPRAQSVTTQSRINSFFNKSNAERADSCSFSNNGSNRSRADNAADPTCLKQCGVQVEYKQVPLNIGLNKVLDSDENLKMKLDKKTALPEGYEISMQAAVRKDDACTSPIVTSSNPFVYMSQVKTPVKSRTVITVKAFVMTLLSQMTYGRDGWHLLVKLCDGSKNMDARLSSGVLEKLFGFSRAEMLAMRREMSANPLLKEKLKSILQNTQQQLINLNCLLDIEFLPESRIPCVIEVTEITEQHLLALQARVKAVGKSFI